MECGVPGYDRLCRMAGVDEFNATLFDSVASVYDEAVPFFVTFGRRLVDWARPCAGTAVLDVGAGKGAVTVAVLDALGQNVSLLAHPRQSGCPDRSVSRPQTRRRAGLLRAGTKCRWWLVVSLRTDIHLLPAPTLGCGPAGNGSTQDVLARPTRLGQTSPGRIRHHRGRAPHRWT